MQLSIVCIKDFDDDYDDYDDETLNILQETIFFTSANKPQKCEKGNSHMWDSSTLAGDTVAQLVGYLRFTGNGFESWLGTIA